MRTRLRILGATAALSTVAVAVPLLSQSGAEAAHFTGGNLVVYRVGDGTAALTNAAAPVYLDEYTPAGAKVQSLALPTTATGDSAALTAAGLSRSEGLLATSGDGKFLAVTGYDAPVGTLGPAAGTATSSSLANTDTTTVPRTVAVVDGDGTIDTTTTISGATAPKIVRSAVTDGSRVWVTGGNGGIQTTQIGSGTVSTVAGTADSNFNALSVQNGQLWASGVLTNRLAAVGTGTPSGSATLTDLPGLPSSLLTYGYALLDLTTASYAGTGVDTLYLADASNRAGTLDKYSYDGTTWKLVDYIDVPGISGLVADKDGDAVSIAVTTPSQLLLVTDPTGASTTAFDPAAPAVLATAPTNSEFRGVALAPTGVLNPATDLLAAGTYSAGDKRIARTGTWKSIKAAAAPGKKGITSVKKGSTATIKVTGSSVVLGFLTGASNGKVQVVVDGKATSFDTYAAKAGTLAKTFSLTGGGTHTVVVKVLGTKSKKSKGVAVSLGLVQVK